MRYATRSVASTFGVIIGLAGLEHGAGEILQGDVPPAGLVFESWPDSEFLRILAGEPAMTILPSLLIAGILTVLFSLLMILWASLFANRRRWGWGLLLLSLVLLLVGGGLGPPLMGGIIAVAAIVAEGLPRSAARRLEGRPPFLARLWRPALVASVLGYLAMLPGIPLVNHVWGITNDMIIAYVAPFSFATLMVAVAGALAWDRRHVAPIHGESQASS